MTNGQRNNQQGDQQNSGQQDGGRQQDGDRQQGNQQRGDQEQQRTASQDEKAGAASSKDGSEQIEQAGANRTSGESSGQNNSNR